MKPFGQLKNEVARKLSVPTGGDYANTQIRDWLQHRYQRVWDHCLWPQTLSIVSVTVTASATTWVLPKRYETALGVLNNTEFKDTSTFDLVTFARRNLQDSSAIYNFMDELAPLGDRGVLTQLSAADTVKVYSGAAADISKQVYVKGLSGGEIVDEVITTDSSDGTTPVAGSVSFTEIHAVTKLTVPTTGSITLTDSSDNELATISPWETSPQYKAYRFFPTSNDAQTLTVVAKKRWVPFLNNADRTSFDIDSPLISGATADGWEEHRQYEMAAREEQRYEFDLEQVIKREMNMAGHVEMWAPAGRF